MKLMRPTFDTMIEQTRHVSTTFVSVSRWTLITREQLATMLYEYAKYKGYDVAKAADLSGFVDQGGISAYAVGPMQWAVAQELIFGVGGNALAPQAAATRAQLAAVLHRFCEAFA